MESASCGTKRCSDCEQTKTHAEFDKAKLGINGLCNRCKKCRSVYTKANRNRDKEQYNAKARARRSRWSPERQMFRSAKDRSLKTGIAFTIKPSDVICPTHCPVFGTKLVQNKGIRGAASDSPSLDRIDNRYGYVPGNIAVISWKANRMKGEASLAELQALVRWLEISLPEQSQQAA